MSWHRVAALSQISKPPEIEEEYLTLAGLQEQFEPRSKFHYLVQTKT